MKPQNPNVEHTAEFSSRRRALFPCDDPSKNDLDFGCISPLDSDEGLLANKTLLSLDKCGGEYDIIGLVEDHGAVVHTPSNNLSLTKITTPSTTDESPTQKLKTPHDTCDNTKFPKLIRNKILTDTVDCKNPKVRTALFPEIDMTLPSRKFYPKVDCEVSPKGFIGSEKSGLRKMKKKQSYYLCNRRSRFRSGQINAGVRHKIKKRKMKKTVKLSTLEAAINTIIDNSPLNDLFDETNDFRGEITEPEEPLRPPSPEPEPDPTKKFFKSSRHKGIVTVSPNIKIEMNNGRFSLVPNKNTLKRGRVQVQEESTAKRAKMTEFEQEQPLIPDNDITKILRNLEQDKENERNAVVLMSPTSQMCNMTSGLALNSPKKARDLSAVLEAMPSNNEQLKLFPVFYPGKTGLPLGSENTRSANMVKKFRGLSKDQMLLDAGQKKFGATECTECKIIYHMGDPGDEIMHMNYHNAGHIFRFNGWKNERVVSNSFLGGKIIQIVPNDPKIWWKKVKEVIEVVNRDLGFYDMEFTTSNSQIFFYVKNRIIIGALVAEAKKSAHKLLTTEQDQVDLCSEESYPIKCGISRVWVAQNHRKKGVATSLIDSLKRNFMYGCILKNEDIALSSPTELGKILGRNYFKTQNFLIYFV